MYLLMSGGGWLELLFAVHLPVFVTFWWRLNKDVFRLVFKDLLPGLYIWGTFFYNDATCNNDATRTTLKQKRHYQ